MANKLHFALCRKGGGLRVLQNYLSIYQYFNWIGLNILLYWFCFVKFYFTFLFFQRPWGSVPHVQLLEKVARVKEKWRSEQQQQRRGFHTNCKWWVARGYQLPGYQCRSDHQKLWEAAARTIRARPPVNRGGRLLQRRHRCPQKVPVKARHQGCAAQATPLGAETANDQRDEYPQKIGPPQHCQGLWVLRGRK